MKVSDLVQAAKPFRKLAGRTSVSSTYRCLELSASGIRGCSSFALLDAAIAMTGLDDTPLYVESAAFLAVVGSLVAGAEVEFTPQENMLEWRCNSGKDKLISGTLAKVSLEGVAMPKMKYPPKSAPEFRPEQDFFNALEMGVLSATTTAIAGTSMYGVLLDNRTGFAVYSCDNTTMSEAVVETPVPLPGQMTLVPEAVALLSMIMSKGAVMRFGATDIYYTSPSFTCCVKAKEPLKHDLTAIMSDYESMNTAALLPRDNINLFIKRVSALAESKRNVVVTLTARDNSIGVSFQEIAASSRELYLIEDMVGVDGELSVQVDGTKLARALGYVDYVVLDFLKRGVVMFVGVHNNFRYLVSARG